MPTVLLERPDAKLLLIGGPLDATGQPLMDEMRALVEELGLDGSVVFTGYRPDVAECLRGLDVAVQASLSENLGGTVEALLMERPVVATRVGGMVETIRHGETGVLVEPADPVDLGRGILRLLRDPAEARRLGLAGRELALERFTLDRTVSDLHSVYSRLLSSPKVGRFRRRVSVARFVALIPLSLYYVVRTLTEVAVFRAWDAIDAARHRSKAKPAVAKDG
jgi:glycosyltransferase involved in cell wall biosynthesis